MPSDPDEPTTASAAGLDPAQVDGLADVDPETYRRMLHEVADLMADYAQSLPGRPVLPPVEPGSIAPLFPASPPEDPEPLAAILDDYRRLVEPNATAWNHPGFMAYFPTSSSAAGVVGELLMASLAQNLFLWRTSPIGTELETVVVSWFRQALGLPEGFDGFVTDTASIGSLIGLAAAREAAGLDAAQHGLANRPEVGQPRVYASAESHSSIDKACMTLGLGRDAVVHIPTDEAYRMRVDALDAAIEDDLAAGRRPIAIVATLGTTASTSADPIAQIARVAEARGLWLHVDAAYAGVIALLPDRRPEFEGWERADSIVVNPHKWLFTPFDASLLLSRRMPEIRASFSLVPEYLRTLDHATPVRDVSEYTPQLGRRFRALKLWVLLRWFGLAGLRRRLAHHLDQARTLASWVDADPDFERLAPVPFSVICLRWRPAALAGREGEPEIATFLDERNQALMEAVNRTGEVLLSHARLGGRFVIRVALGNLRTEDRQLHRVWELLQQEAGRSRPYHPSVPPTQELKRIEPIYLERLERQGIFTTGLLLEVTETPTRRQTLADQVDASVNDVLMWRDEGQMLNLAGFGPEEHQLFSQAGFEGLEDILEVDLETFRSRLGRAAEELKMEPMSDLMTESWWDQAHTLAE